MSGFTMVVIDKSWDKAFEVRNVDLVPRIGDHIYDFERVPTPKVTEVVWEYKIHKVTVYCD